jgi:hypothetical protein
MGARFWDVYRDVRSVIQKPDDAIYILHTSIGAITVHKFVYRGEAERTSMGGSVSQAFPNNSCRHLRSRFV